jgi:dTDP-4-dehydrorhamnose reductase
MKTLVTGLNGTLAPVLAQTLRRAGHDVVGWDRHGVSPDDRRACKTHLDTLAPRAVFHLAMGSESWAGLLAGWCHERGVPFLFASTAMVFDKTPDGPHRIGAARTAQDEYGRYKIRCEDAIAAASSSAIIVRMGWQIGATRGGNTMLEALCRMAEHKGVVRASTAWRPACSFMTDTAAALIGLVDDGVRGVFHADSNAEDALDFCTIACRLDALHGAGWTIEPTADYRHDQRLIDTRLTMPPLSERLPG